MSLDHRIRRARLEFAAIRGESAATIALTIIGAPVAYLLGKAGLVPQWSWIGVLGFGLLGEAAIVLSSIWDKSAGTFHIRAGLAEHFGVAGIKDAALRDQVLRAFEYRIRMHDVLRGAQIAAADALGETLASVDVWLAGIGRLASRLDGIRQEARLHAADKDELNRRVADLKARAEQAKTDEMRRQLGETIAALRHQLRMIEELEGHVERGYLRLEQAIVALGTIHTQVTIFAAKGMDEGDADRIAAEIRDERERVDAILLALDRVYELDGQGSMTPALREGREA